MGLLFTTAARPSKTSWAKSRLVSCAEPKNKNTAAAVKLQRLNCLIRECCIEWETELV
jgi:hypothetical protein